MKKKAIKIEKADTFTAELLEALQRLLPQLSPGTAISGSWLRELLADPDIHLFVTRDETGAINGTFTLAQEKIPTGLKVWLEDVVVDEQARGQGLGEAIVLYAIEYAGKLGTKKLDLTSAPDRVAANRLYQKTGFILRETNVYRMRFR